MNGDTAKQLRTLLLANPKGLEIWAIANALGREYTNVAKRLHATYGCYVKGWNGQRQVWACIPEPANAPRPPYVRKPYAPYKPERLNKECKPKRESAAVRANRAEPITQDILEAPAYKPQKTVWVPVAPWPKQESL